MSIFGYDYQRSSNAGDFLPIVKYDARAGRISRVDRTQDAVNGNWITEQVDITNAFKALADFENMESGWINFATGGAPSFVMVPRTHQLPPCPTPDHKFGIRFLIKLAKHCAGNAPIRELAGTARNFLDGTGIVVQQYLDQRAQYPGQLPVIVLASAMPITSGSTQKSTNYQPAWQIVGWAPRGDLQPKPRAAAPVQTQTQTNGYGQTAPATGSTRVAPPPQSTAPAVSPDDF